MNNKEKYYNYVVDDLVKRTELKRFSDRHYSYYRIKYPFIKHFEKLPVPTYRYAVDHNPYALFTPYVISIYGVSDEEVEMVWNIYRDRINLRK